MSPKSVEHIVLINGEPPNLFRGLITYRPRPDRASRENFLTEAFAYVLAMDPMAAIAVLQEFVGTGFKIKRLVGITTQESLPEGSESRGGIPDMQIEIVTDGGMAHIWIENKWDAPVDRNQLERYLECLDRLERRTRRFLILLTPRHSDANVRLAVVKTPYTHISWSKVHDVVRKSGSSQVSREFEAFLRESGLIVLPISREQARTRFVKVESLRGRRKDRFREDLRAIVSRADDQLPRIGIHADSRVVDNYGRVGAWMFDSRVTLGLIYDPAVDHYSQFISESNPLDLFFRLEGPCKRTTVGRQRERLRPLAAALEEIGYSCDRGRWKGNYHSIVMGHYSEPFPFDRDADEQVMWVSKVFSETLSRIEKDVKLMKLIRSVDGYSG